VENESMGFLGFVEERREDKELKGSLGGVI